jgi:hypothetical protein
MNTDGIAYLFFFKNWKYFIFQIDLIAANVSRAGDRSPVLRLRQGYGACTLLWAGFINMYLCRI